MDEDTGNLLIKVSYGERLNIEGEALIQDIGDQSTSKLTLMGYSINNKQLRVRSDPDAGFLVSIQNHTKVPKTDHNLSSQGIVSLRDGENMLEIKKVDKTTNYSVSKEVQEKQGFIENESWKKSIKEINEAVDKNE